ncbi:MAG: winged helix-turn-helix domain-containing tetratricopeptide repeat protein [Xanthobacteraceae bacterium]|jgi:TolB-like protein
MTGIYTFGPFRLDVAAGILFRGAEPVALGQRAVALLHMLVEGAGTPISKDRLIESAWPGLSIEESNLTVQIAALRRTFAEEPGGENWIETLPRRGYRYVGPAVANERPSEGAAAHAQPATALALPDKPSLAVLPFTNMSGDPEQEYFADGMVEDIITGLSRIKWLFVVARNSSFTYKAQSVSVSRVGRELGVRYVLEGSVRKAGQHVRITGQLVEAETGVHIWAEKYDRPLDDIFALQDEITLNVVGAIQPSLREAEIERVKRKRPENLDAYDLALRALPYVSVAMPAEAVKAMPLLERALAIEGDYATAHGLLAWCHEILFTRRGFSKVSREAAIRHAHATLAYGRDDATALALGGFVISMIEHDRATAFEAFEQALAISPSSSFALFFGSTALAYAGEAERAIDWAERALRISPFDRLNYASYHALAIGHFLRGRYDEAAHAARRAVQSIPSLSVSRSLLAAALAKLGRIEEAKAVALQVLALEPTFSAARFCAALGLPTALVEPITDAWSAAGLPP